MSPLNPSVKLYRETECRHGYVGGHPITEWNELRQRDDLLDCNGGSREEVIIDYAEAFSTWWRHDHILNDQERLVIAIDAAFKSAGFTKKFTSEESATE